MSAVRGINLGGWLVLEKWMKPELFNGVEGPDETVFSIQADRAEEKIEEHWKTFITKEDFKYISELGLDSVRIPVPWWMFINESPYFNGIDYLDQAMNWADEYKLKVLLDLHTVPGCQNGFDNGGLTGVINWDKDKQNIKKSLEVIERMVKRYKHHESLWGIEVLNEPHWTIDMPLLQQFYIDAYKLIRTHLKDAYIVFHDSFRPEDEAWISFFNNNSFEHVLFDLHLYQCFDGAFNDFDISEHVAYALQSRVELIRKINDIVPTIIGEWSLGLHGKVFDGFDQFQKVNALTSYANAQLLAYENSFGWYFWSYKLDRNDHLDGWNFKHLIEEGVFPKKYK